MIDAVRTIEIMITEVKIAGQIANPPATHTSSSSVTIRLLIINLIITASMKVAGLETVIVIIGLMKIEVDETIVKVDLIVMIAMIVYLNHHHLIDAVTGMI